MNNNNYLIPSDVTSDLRKTFVDNYLIATKNSGRLMLIGGDHEGEDGMQTHKDPEYMFRIASKAKIGVFSTLPEHLLYVGMDYPDLPYVIRLNTKFDIKKQPTTIKDIVELQKKNALKIVGLRYKISFGSQYESEMIQEAAQVITDAHQNGLLAIIWGQFDTKKDNDMKKAAQVAATLKADFLKVSYSDKDEQQLKNAVQMAGRTKLVCAGGSVTEANHFLKTLYDQLHVYNTGGNATGRNIESRPFDEAVRLCNAISALTIENKSLNEAVKIYNGN